MQLLGLSTVSALALVAESHMLLNKPQMFPSSGVPDNGPLIGPGKGISNYPCKSSPGSTTVYDFSFPRTQLPLGSNYSLELKGQAVHGGGSCQISLSKDLAPDAQSSFKVIYSIEGGCPARNTAGNLGGDASAIDPDHYNFEIPSDLEPGDYTFAWTWFNKVGNREMYMNCAPITITRDKRDVAETDSAAAFDALPDLFLANIPDVECLSPEEGEDANMQFPNPGSSVETTTPGNLSPPRGNTAKCHAPVGKAAAPASGISFSAAASGFASAGLTTGFAFSARATTSAVTISSSFSVNPTSIIIVPITDSSLAPTSSSIGYASLSSMPVINLPPFASFSLKSKATPVSNPTTSYAFAASLSSSIGTTFSYTSALSSAPIASAGTCSSGHVACSTVGTIVCIGAESFGICNVNLCAVAQPLAAGTFCSNGVITKRSLRLSPCASRGLV